MAGESMDVLDQLGFTSCRGGTAYAGAERDADERCLDLERPQHQFAIDVAIEARPVEIGQILPQQRGRIGHIRDRIAFPGGQPVERAGEVAIELGLASGGNVELIHVLILEDGSLREA